MKNNKKLLSSFAMTFFLLTSSHCAEKLLKNGDIEQQISSGSPLFWNQIRHYKAGKLFIGKGYKGKSSLGIAGDTNPAKPLGWGQKILYPQLAKIKPGDFLAVDFDLTTFANPSVKVRCYAEFMDGKKYVGTYGKNFTVYANWERKKHVFPMISKKFTHVWIYFVLKSEGKACIDNVQLRRHKQEVKKKISDNYCRIKNLPPRRTWIEPSFPEKMVIEFKSDGPEIEIQLAEIDGKHIQSRKFINNSPGRINTLIFPLPRLQEGAYELNFKSGKMTDTEWFAIRKKTADVHFSQDGYMIFKGKKFFPIAMAHPNRLGNAGLDGLRVYAQSGINMISEYEITSKLHADYLNAVCNKFNFVLWLKEDFGHRRQKTEAIRNYLKKLAQYAAKIDNFAGLQSDEAAWSQWPLDSVRHNSKLRFKYLPQYFTWQCTAPRLTGNLPRNNFHQVRRYALAADVTGVDIYPVPEGKAGHNNLPNKTLSCVGDYTELIRKAVWDQRPIWMVLQGMSWREERLLTPNNEWPRPSKEQLRFMVWNAITHGATGICWYGHGVWTDQYSEWYRQFAEVNLELSAIAKVMLEGKKEALPPVPAKIGVLHRSGVLIYVNEDNKKEMTVKISGKWFVSPGGKVLNQKEYTLKPYEVLILTASPVKLKPIKRFVPQNTTLAEAAGIEMRTHLINGEWVSHPDFLKGGEQKILVKQNFYFPDRPREAFLHLSADDKAIVKINGKLLSGDFSGHRNVNKINISRWVKKGNNQLELELFNYQGQSAVVFDIATDKTCVSSGKNTQLSLDGKIWKSAHLCGKPPLPPWGKPVLLINHK